jgi:hypothetical protein
MTGTAEVGGQRRHRKVHATGGRKKTESRGHPKLLSGKTLNSNPG